MEVVFHHASGFIYRLTRVPLNPATQSVKLNDCLSSSAALHVQTVSCRSVSCLRNAASVIDTVLIAHVQICQARTETDCLDAAAATSGDGAI